MMRDLLIGLVVLTVFNYALFFAMVFISGKVINRDKVKTDLRNLEILISEMEKLISEKLKLDQIEDWINSRLKQ